MIEIPIYDPACNYRLTAAALKAPVDKRTAIVHLVEIESFTAVARDCGALLVHDCSCRDLADGQTRALCVAPQDAAVSMSFSK